MAVVQLSWRDNSDNETSFKVYRGTSSPVSTSDDHIANITLSGSTWSASEASTGSAPDITLTSSANNTGDSVTTGETFVITYTENTSGNYYYGVSASNAIGDSDIVTTASVLNVA
jgi:hypothetical protein